jgi:hypothetical protein
MLRSLQQQVHPDDAAEPVAKFELGVLREFDRCRCVCFRPCLRARV